MTVSTDSPHTIAHLGLGRLGRLTALATACLALAACSSFNNISGSIGGLITPYKVDVVQGNFVSKEQKDALQVGMPRAQVRDILGSPLVTSAFHADRWEYVFTILRQGAAPQQRKLTVFFKGDELAKVDSDELISEEEFVTSLSANRRLGKVPLLEVPPEVLREFGLKNSAPNTAAAVINPAQSAINSGAPTSYPPLEAPGRITSAWDASTQRAVAASIAARPSVSPTSSNTPLLPAQASLPAPASVAAAAPVPTAPVARAVPPPAPAPAPVAPRAAPAPTPVPVPVPTQAATPAVAPRVVATVPAAAPAVIAAAPAAPPIPMPAPAPRAVAVPIPAPAPTPAPAPVAVAPSPAAVAAASSAPAPVVSPPPPVSSVNTLAAADPDITTFLNRWTSDWQARNAAAYFAHYLPEFKGTSNTRAEWESLRRTRIEGRSRITLAVFDVRVRMVSPTEARLVFRQDYDSDAYREVGTKAMFLVKRDGRWFIEREFFTPAQ